MMETYCECQRTGATLVEVKVVGLKLKLKRSPTLGFRFVEIGLLEVSKHRRSCSHAHNLHQATQINALLLFLLAVIFHER